MRLTVGGNACAEGAMRAQILAVLEDLCSDVTLQDVREWYFDSLTEQQRSQPPATGLID